MDKDVKPYKQKGPTCAIACLLMVLEYYGVIENPNQEQEELYYNMYKSKYIDGAHFSALALHFSKKRLETELVHSEDNIFKNENEYIPEHIYDKVMEEYKEFISIVEIEGIKIKNGINIDCDLLKQYLNKDNLIILAGEQNSYLHAILLTGYNNGGFIVWIHYIIKNKLEYLKI